ncbi:hypothetical protein LCGC14_2543700, partial [marine sediment metagenome]
GAGAGPAAGRWEGRREHLRDLPLPVL